MNEKYLVSIVGLGKYLYLVDFEEIKNAKKCLRNFAKLFEKFNYAYVLTTKHHCTVSYSPVRPSTVFMRNNIMT